MRRIGVYSFTLCLCHFGVSIALVYGGVAEVGSVLLVILVFPT